MTDTPASKLTKPTPSDPVPDLAENVIGASQYISVSYWVGEFLNLIFGVNPGEWASEKFSGDWQLTQTAAVALQNLQEFNADFSQAINSAVNDVSHDWEGVAANQANSYFSELANAIQDQKDTLDDLSQQFDMMATGMYEAAKAVKGFLDMILDYAIALALEAIAGMLSSETVVGSIAAGAAFAATLTKAMGVAGQAIQAHTVAWNSVQACIGVIASQTSALQGIDKYALPGNNYDHPGV